MTWIAPHTYYLIMYVWIAIALCTFIALFFIKQPYGRHTSTQFGPMIDNRLGWVIMELPSPLVFSYFFFSGVAEHTSMHYLLYCLYIIHYINRTFIFPFRTKTDSKKMPLLISVSAIFFNLMNGFANGYALGNFSLFTDSYILICLGLILFIVGFYINNRSDHILLNLRKPGDSSYYIPQGFLFNKITSPNYFGEIIEWFGFFLMNIQIGSFSFLVWCIANLVPRARDHHRWYQDKFAEYPKERKIIFPYLY